jgi:hypothetical protein
LNSTLREKRKSLSTPTAAAVDGDDENIDDDIDQHNDELPQNSQIIVVDEAEHAFDWVYNNNDADEMDVVQQEVREREYVLAFSIKFNRHYCCIGSSATNIRHQWAEIHCYYRF